MCVCVCVCVCMCVYVCVCAVCVCVRAWVRAYGTPFVSSHQPVARVYSLLVNLILCVCAAVLPHMEPGPEFVQVRTRTDIVRAHIHHRRIQGGSRALPSKVQSIINHFLCTLLNFISMS